MNDTNPPPLPEAASPKRRTNGCLVAAVVTVVLGVLVFAVGGYYAMMHSSLPLRSFASMINSSGQAKIEGLDGTLATGFRFDEFRIFKTGPGDSYVRDVNFKFNGMPEVSASGRLIIDELHIGRIYLSLPDGNVQASEKKTKLGKEIDQKLEAGTGEPLQRFEVKSFRIDEVIVQDAAGERSVGSARLAGLVAEGERLQLDEFTLNSEFIEARLDAAPASNRFSQMIQGVVHPGLHTNVIRPLDFVLRFGGETNGGAMRIELFGGGLIASGERDGTSHVQLTDFSPREWLGGFPAATPSAMSFSLTGNKSGKRSKVGAGRLVLGKMSYQVPEQELDHTGFGGGRLRAETEIDGRPISVEISDPEGADGFRYTFAGDGWDGNELIAHALFGKAFADLTGTERNELSAFKGPVGTDSEPPASTPGVDITPAAP